MTKTFSNLGMGDGKEKTEATPEGGAPVWFQDLWKEERSKAKMEAMEVSLAAERKLNMEKKMREYVLEMFWGEEMGLAVKANRQLPPMKEKPRGRLYYPNLGIELPLKEELGELAKQGRGKPLAVALEDYFTSCEMEEMSAPLEGASGGVRNGLDESAPSKELLFSLGCRQAFNQVCLGPCDFCYQKSMRQIANLRRKKQILMEVFEERDRLLRALHDSVHTPRPIDHSTPLKSLKTPPGLAFDERDGATCRDLECLGQCGFCYNQSLQVMKMTGKRKRQYHNFVRVRRTLFEDEQWPTWPQFLDEV